MVPKTISRNNVYTHRYDVFPKELVGQIVLSGVIVPYVAQISFKTSPDEKVTMLLLFNSLKYDDIFDI